MFNKLLDRKRNFACGAEFVEPRSLPKCVIKTPTIPLNWTQLLSQHLFTLFFFFFVATTEEEMTKLSTFLMNRFSYTAWSLVASRNARLFFLSFSFFIFFYFFQLFKPKTRLSNLGMARLELHRLVRRIFSSLIMRFCWKTFLCTATKIYGQRWQSFLLVNLCWLPRNPIKL